MLLSPRCAARLLLSVTLGAPLGAEVVTLGAVADTSLFGESLFGSVLNFGGHTELPAGALGAGARDPVTLELARTRALFKFDIAAGLPAGATIEEARMKLTTSTMVPDQGGRTSDFALSRVLVDWGEGTGTSLEPPGGRDAMEGEATWINRFHPDMAWSIPGGAFGTDFVDAQSALAEDVMGSSFNPITYIFNFNATGLADLQGMLDGSFPNYGWVLYSLTEDRTKTARRWFSSDTSLVGKAPELEITWSLPVIAPSISSITFDEPSQEIRVTLSGLVGYSYELQGSTNLTAWQPGPTQTPVLDGEFVFVVPFNGAAEFFRVEATLLP